MFSRSPRTFEREAAKTGRPVAVGLAVRGTCVSVNTVVAARDERAGTTCLYRYPSPVGRRGLQIGRPPVFSGLDGGKTLSKQRFAENMLTCSRPLPRRVCGAMVPLAHVPERKGTSSCTQSGTLGHGFWPLRPARALRLAATPLVNRPCWGRAPARPALSFWTQTPERARCWARLPMSPIANNTRRAAPERVAPACGPELNRKPISAPCRDGFFVAIAPGTAKGPRPEGTRNVQ